jgi:hypothetical protein
MELSRTTNDAPSNHPLIEFKKTTISIIKFYNTTSSSMRRMDVADLSAAAAAAAF